MKAAVRPLVGRPAAASRRSHRRRHEEEHPASHDDRGRTGPHASGSGPGVPVPSITTTETRLDQRLALRRSCDRVLEQRKAERTEGGCH